MAYKNTIPGFNHSFDSLGHQAIVVSLYEILEDGHVKDYGPSEEEIKAARTLLHWFLTENQAKEVIALAEATHGLGI
jgi:hypothetical protein